MKRLSSGTRLPSVDIVTETLIIAKNMKKPPIFLIVFLITVSAHLYALPWQGDSAYLNIRVNNDTTTELQNEEQIIMNPNDTTNLVAVWRDFRLGYRQVGYGCSFDGGLTWHQDLFLEPQYTRDSDPGLTVDTAGNFYAVILSFDSTDEPNGLFMYKSTDGGMSWSDPTTVINGVPGVFEDKELIACDRSDGQYNGHLYVVWTRFWMTHILLSRSTDQGNSFEPPVQVSDIDGVQWPVPCIGANSEVYVAWVNFDPGAIRFDRSTDGGQTFGSDMTVQNVSFVAGYINGNISVYSFPAMDADITSGPFHGSIYCAYMDYSSGFTDTDIYFTRSTDGGMTWSQRSRINDDTLDNGCDQFHPWLTVAPDGSITVVFLDRRLDSENLLMDLYMTTSADGGDTWSANTRITTESSDPTGGSHDSFESIHTRPTRSHTPTILAERAGLLGEYIGVTASSLDDIHPIWTDTRHGHQDAFVGVKDSTSPFVQEYGRNVGKNVLLSILPNPAKRKTVIDIMTHHEAVLSDATLRIFDLSGRAVKTFKRPPHRIIWNGESDTGELVASGIYFCSLETTTALVIKKFILVYP